MKKKYLFILMIAGVLLCGCDKTESNDELHIEVTSQTFQQASEESTTSETSQTETTTFSETSAVISEETALTGAETSESSVKTPESVPAEAEDKTEENTSSAAQTEAPVTEAPQEITTETETFETFTGILIDEDCSDFEDPPSHDLPCMLMDECRASGYGIDILQDDGTWKFYMFDEKGQDLSWDYLIHTSRMDKLYVNVTGTLKDGKIYVNKLEEK